VTYKVRWQEEALEDLLSLPKKNAEQIVKKVETYLTQNPQNLGKALTGKFSGLYRYRMGDYRIIYEIIKQELCIYVVHIGHRKDVYD